VDSLLEFDHLLASTVCVSERASEGMIRKRGKGRQGKRKGTKKEGTKASGRIQSTARMKERKKERKEKK
jgi:hypothetical protein